MVIAGRQSQPESAADWNSSKLSVHSFENGSLVDKTAQWFTGTDNVIIGTEPDVKFADFFNTGRTRYDCYTLARYVIIWSCRFI